MKNSQKLVFALLLSACGKFKNTTQEQTAAKSEAALYEEKVLNLQSQMTTTTTQVSFGGQTIVDFSQNTPVVSDYGTFQKGNTLNYFTINGVTFLIYGEDGVFAAECEANPADPSLGPTHPLCETAHAESYDTIIFCVASDPNAVLATAQNWPGVAQAFESGRGMSCWVNGTKMKSTHVFTY